MDALSPLGKVETYREQLIQLKRLLRSSMALTYDHKVAQVEKLSDALMMLDTSRIVARGYAIVKKDSKVIESVKTIKKEDELTLIMRDGQVEIEVKDVKR